MRRNFKDLWPDSVFCAFSGLLLTSREQAVAFKNEYDEQKVLRIMLSEDYFATTQSLFEVFEQDPYPIDLSNLYIYKHIPDDIPTSPEQLHVMNALTTNSALKQAAAGDIQDPCITWMRKQNLWGYLLTHQWIAWLLCLKRQYHLREAEEKVPMLAWRMYHELKNCPFEVYYDLFAERVAFLGLAGFPLRCLREEYVRILQSQDVDDGGWYFFSATKDDQLSVLYNVLTGQSPLIDRPRWYNENEELDDQGSYLMNVHRGHATGLSIWALLLLLKRTESWGPPELGSL